MNIRTDADIDAALSSLKNCAIKERQSLAKLLLVHTEGFAQFVLQQVSVSLGAVELLETLSNFAVDLTSCTFEADQLTEALERGFQRQMDSIPWIHAACRVIALQAEASEKRRVELGSRMLIEPLVETLRTASVNDAAPVASALSKLNAGRSHAPSVISSECGVMEAAVNVIISSTAAAEGDRNFVKHNALLASLWSVVSLCITHLRGSSKAEGPGACWKAGMVLMEASEGLSGLVRSLKGFTIDAVGRSLIQLGLGLGLGLG